jgi:hypothetical protein
MYKNEKTRNHFIRTCSKLDSVREPLLVEIISTCSQLFAKHKLDLKLDLLTEIVNPYYYCSNPISNSLVNEIGVYLEPLCITWCYELHTERYKLLDISSSKRKLSRKVTEHWEWLVRDRIIVLPCTKFYLFLDLKSTVIIYITFRF